MSSFATDWVVAVGMDQVRVAEGLSPEYTWAVVIAGQPTIQLDDGCTTTETGAAARPTPAPAQRTSAQPTISRPRRAL